MKPRLLGGCSCAGGADVGFWRAGWEVVGVDIEPQPNYPFTFIQADILDVLEDRSFMAGFDAAAISPPCQKYTPLNAYNHKEYPDLIAPVRQRLDSLGLPYVIENVEAAASELCNPATLCGLMFGLQVRRHRLFEANWDLMAPAHPEHVELCTRNGYLPTLGRPLMTITGGRHSRAWQNAACDAMDMPWIKVQPGGDIKRGIREVCEAIPPAYTEFIGQQLMAELERGAAA